MTAREKLAEALRAHGHQLWLVGGALRDRLLGSEGGDADYATDALPDEVERIAASLGARTVAVGRRFGTIAVELDGVWAEITTFRGESYAAGTRWPEVTFGKTIEEDLARRDFTVNALAEEVATGRFLDPFGGLADLRAGLLRAVGDPLERFAEDPLRILRGVRFVAQLGFEIVPETARAMKESAPLLRSLSAERVAAELDRLLQARHPDRGLEALVACGGLAQVLPELTPMLGCEQNRFHELDVWGHTVATVRAIDGPPGTLRHRRWAALLHDVGKPRVRERGRDGDWSFHRHEVVGAEIAEALLKRLRLGHDDVRAIVLLVRRHMDRPSPGERRSVRRFLHRCEGRWEDLLALKAADNETHTYDDQPYIDALARACRVVSKEDAEALRARSPLSGDDLMELFARGPGPWIREVKERLSAMVLDGELDPGDREAAIRVARAIMGESGPD